MIMRMLIVMMLINQVTVESVHLFLLLTANRKAMMPVRKYSLMNSIRLWENSSKGRTTT